MKFFLLCISALFVMTGCAQTNVVSDGVESLAKSMSVVDKGTDYEYMQMSKFDVGLASFVGLVPGESFEQSEAKIKAVFKAYEGHAEPQNIGMEKSTVEADWKQILVTQDGLLDETVTGQQMLAIFDQEGRLVSYGMRIKCYSESGQSEWQTTVCE